MPKEKNPIIALQDLYLTTKEEKYLTSLYQSLIRLGITVQAQVPEVSQDPDAVLDVASSVCIRLMTKDRPILRHPSAYIRQALFYKNKDMFHDSLDEEEFVQAEQQPCSNSYELYACRIMDRLYADHDIETEMAELVSSVVMSRVRADKVAGKLDPVTRSKFLRLLEEVRAYVEKDLQSSRMQQTC